MQTSLSTSDTDLLQKFEGLRSLNDVADMLEVPPATLRFHLYVKAPASAYTVFHIPKRSGGIREIAAPCTPLKILQQKLAHVLLLAYRPKPVVHSYLPTRSIVSNARVHQGKNLVMNIDLEDFFPSITFPRVRGMLIGRPYFLPSGPATVLAQICCFGGRLPQGAPTSPIVSNMLCAQMDAQLTQLAKRSRCYYTRYADDITFSTNLFHFPSVVMQLDLDGAPSVGEEIAQIVQDNGFALNLGKFKVRQNKQRQEVTGLTTNQFPNVRRTYVRRVRGMLHAWRKYGLNQAQSAFWQQHDRKARNPWHPHPDFRQVVLGRIAYIGMVKGKDDAVYQNLLERFRDLAPDLVHDPVRLPSPYHGPRAHARVFTEGKTDCKHLKAAFAAFQNQGVYQDLRLTFVEPRLQPSKGGKKAEKGGDTEVMEQCRHWAKEFHGDPCIFVFDRDNPPIVKEASQPGHLYKDWDNTNVYSFALPVPRHRRGNQDISVELLYQDSDLKRYDGHGRRLYTNDEFNKHSGRHLDRTKQLWCQERNKLQRATTTVIDTGVFDANDTNVAMSKSDFAQNVLDGAVGFENLDFSGFRLTFDAIASIVAASIRKHKPSGVTAEQGRPTGRLHRFMAWLRHLGTR